MLELSLKKSELILYAIIYAFTKGEAGLFYGSKRHLAYLSALSERTVHRALSSLVEKGYVEKTEIGKKTGFRIKAIQEMPKDSYLPKEISEEIEKKNIEKEAKVKEPSKSYKIDFDLSDLPNISPSNNESNASNLRSDLDKFIDSMIRMPPIKPRYEIIGFGRYGYVGMTGEQFKKLCEIADSQTVTAYVRKFERMLERNTSESSPHSAYKTIRKWLVEDFGT
jgi:DNA-binding transcriptional regulator YhcF (GntR family)